ncbi:GNAT family N-acetyltransferase [Streptomyces sp. NRRL S-920]|uniref:GNAT family N-acetyltransferase n=1 Tax=Streptomyces sp. NRRL S-920 TaxID=1463921 RepID=UPI0004C747D5|nr:GNAT family N-acetyltransferase [Streptomyces sp. NRRL S-920]
MISERTGVQVRPGVETDLEALTDLYNHYVRETAVTFDTVTFLPEERRPWLLSHPEDGPHRLLVAQERQTGTRPGRLLGYATSSPFRSRPAYSTSVEVSAYCVPDAYDEVGRKFGRYWDVAWYERPLGRRT